MDDGRQKDLYFEIHVKRQGWRTTTKKYSKHTSKYLAKPSSAVSLF